MFNIEDTHVVAYALKKLEALGAGEAGSARASQKTARITKEGAESLPALPGSEVKALIESVASLRSGLGDNKSNIIINTYVIYIKASQV